MTVEELKRLLRRIANHLNHLQDEQENHALQATRYSQTDSHKSHGGPSEPLSITALDYTIQELDTRCQAWCYALANYHTIGQLPHDQPASIWIAWLSRHAKLLLATDYADHTIEELQDFEAELRSRIHPQDPHSIDLPEFATINDLAHALDKTPTAMRKWCERHNLTKYTIGGKVHYKTSEATAAKNT